MNLPKIDVTSLPDLELMTAMFSVVRRPGHNDSIVVLATIVYESGSAII